MNNRCEVRSKLPVLIIDDEEAHLKTMADILDLEGLQPICCSNGKQALEACKKYKINVVILDLRLPDIDGLELLKLLKQKNRDVKVIVNTAYASLESAMTAINEEAFAYVKKLGNVDELLSHVHRAFHTYLAVYSYRLERKVKKRTAELAKVNEKLIGKIEVII